MKKQYASLFFAVALAFTSCSDDAVNPPSGNPSSAENVVFFTQVSEDQSNATLFRVNIDGTGKAKIADSSVIYGHSFKNKIAYTKLDVPKKTAYITLADANGGNAQTLLSLPRPTDVILSPTATKIAYQLLCWKAGVRNPHDKQQRNIRCDDHK